MKCIDREKTIYKWKKYTKAEYISELIMDKIKDKKIKRILSFEKLILKKKTY